MITDGNFIGTFPIIIEDVGLLQLIKMLFFTIKKIDITLEEQIEMAEYIEANTNPDQRLLCLGVPELLFLSNRKIFNKHIFYPADIIYLQETGKLTSLQEKVMEETPLISVSKNYSIKDNASNITENFSIPQQLGLSEFINEEYEIMMQTKNYGLLKKK